MRKIIGPIVVVVAIIVAVSAATHHNTPTSPTSSPALVISTTGTGTGTGTAPGSTASVAATTAAPPAHPQTFTGTGTENIGTINVAVASTLHWSCPSCGADNFQVFNSANDSGLIGVNGLDQTGGQTVLDAGTYTDVTINTEGQGWTITIDPGT
jgi:hypothetical protein